MKYLKIAFIFVLIIFLPQLVLAASDQPNLFGEISFAVPSQDISIVLLRQIFGNVGFGVEAGTGTLLAQLFGIFNAGIVSVSGLFLIYTIAKSVMSSAMAGEVMGKYVNHWVPFRVAVGIGLLVPKATGYSVLNTIVMWVVVQGIGFADFGWRHALSYLNQGGMLYVQAVSDSADQADRPEYIDKSIITGKDDGRPNEDVKERTSAGNVHVLKSIICMQYMHNLVDKESDLVKKHIKANPHDYPDVGSTDYNKLQNLLKIPDFKPTFDSENGVASFPGGLDEPYDRFNGVCGTYSWIWEPASDNDRNIYMPVKETALQQVYYDMDSSTSNMISAAMRLPDGTTGDQYDEFLAKYKDSMGMQLLNSVADYQSVLYPVRVLAGNNYVTRSEASQKDAAADLSFLRDDSDAVNQGWFTAAKYWYDLMTLRPTTSKLEDAHFRITVKNPPPNYSPSIIGNQNAAFGKLKGVGEDMFVPYVAKESDSTFKPWTKVWSDGEDLLKKLLAWTALPEEQARTLADAVKKNIDTGEDLSKIIFDKEQQKLLSQKSGVVDASSGFGNVYGAAGLVYGPLSDRIDSIVKVWVEQMVENKDNNLPIVKLQILGNSMVKNCVGFWDDVFENLSNVAIGYIVLASAAQLVIAGLAPGSFFGTSLGAQNALSALIDIANNAYRLIVELPIMIALPLSTAVIAPVFVTGIILSYYTPLIPFMLFTFGTISWLIFVIEAMAAAPIVALGVTHPEGHDLLGKSEQAIMLLLSVFVRPITMIIGLVVSIILCNIVLEVLNVGYGHIVSRAFFGSELPALDDSMLRTIRHLAVIVLYPFIAMPMVNQCSSPINLIPEKVMRWIGLHPDTGPEAQMVEGVKGMVQTQAEAGARGAGGAAERGGGAAAGTGLKQVGMPKTEEKAGAKADAKKPEPEGMGGYGAYE